MTSYPGCVTPTEVDPESVGWAEKPICPPTVHPFMMRKRGSEESEQTFYGTSGKLKVTTELTSTQTFYGTSSVLKVERVG